MGVSNPSVNVRPSRDGFKRLVVEVDAEVENTKKQAVEVMFKELMRLSPVVTGSYLMSHRIGEGLVDRGYHVIPQTSRRWNEGNIRARLVGYLNAFLKRRVAGDIFLSNSVPWAKNIEFEGWHFPGGGSKPPYRVYRKAYLRAQAALANVKHVSRSNPQRNRK